MRAIENIFLFSNTSNVNAYIIPDELRLRINELSLENEALRESIRSKDSLIRDRDVVSLQLQREIKDLKEQLRQSNENKNELLQLNESKIR